LESKGHGHDTVQAHPQFGLNDRTSIAETTAIRNLKTMICHLSKKFPKSVIYPVQINFSNNLSYNERANLDKINKAITDLSNIQNYT